MARSAILLAALAAAAFPLPGQVSMTSGQAYSFSTNGTYQCTGSGLAPTCYLGVGYFNIDVPQGATELEVRVTLDPNSDEVIGEIALGSPMTHTSGAGWIGSGIGVAIGGKSFVYALATASKGTLVLTPGVWSIGLNTPVTGIQTVSASGTIVASVWSSAPPVIGGMSPSAARAGGQAFTLTVNGSGFVAGSVVQWNGAPLATNYVSATQLTSTVPASLIASAGSANVTVQDTGGPASFYSIQFIVASKTGNVYTISTVAGNGTHGSSGDGGPATSAALDTPMAVAVDSSGSLYIADRQNNRVRKVAANGIITTVAGTGTYGFSGDGGPAASAELNSPGGVAVDAGGNLYIADSNNSRIRKVAPNGIITTVAGTGISGYSGDGGPAASAQLNTPRGLRADPAGNLFIADPLGSVIRKVDTNGIITTVAGNGTYGDSADGGLATSAALENPNSVGVDAAGDIYFTNPATDVIRKVDINGILTTVVGQDKMHGFDSGGDGELATQAVLDAPYGLDADAAGDIFLIDNEYNVVREVTTDGKIYTIAGKAMDNAGYNGDGGLATDALLNGPQGVTVGPYGRVYVLDTGNNVVRLLTPLLPGEAGSLAQIASAGGWDTALTLVNLDATANQAQLNFYASDGSVPQLAFTFPQQPSQAAVTGASLNETLAASALMVFDTTGPAGLTSIVGSSQLLTSGNVGGFGIFQIQSTGQQAVVPLETRNAPSYLVAFDETNGLNTGLALANVSAAAGSVKVVVRDDTGAVIPAKVAAIPLFGNGHASFMLNDPAQGFPEIAGKRGTVEFDTPSGGQISVLGLRANGNAITTLPVLAQVGTTGGSFAHVATGGGWETLFTLVNTGTGTASFTLNFYDEQTGVLLPLSLLFPQHGATQTTAAVTQTLAPGATLLIETQGGSKTLTCSAHLTTAGNVSGFAIFRIQGSGQEAVVPLETRASGTFVLAYDNTGVLGTGVSLANVSAAAASVPVRVRDDTGTTLTTGTISLAANGHTSFLLTDATHGYPVTAGKRGTVEFQTPAGGQIGALGIRAVGSSIITTIPVLAK
jgi:sugar lactone lactonase YvrE